MTMHLAFLKGARLPFCKVRRNPRKAVGRSSPRSPLQMEQLEERTLLDADLAIVKNDSPDPVVAGTAFSYSIVLTNNGPNDATGVTVNDTLPAGLTFNVAGSSS